MSVSNPASALGEAVGKLIEYELEQTLAPICKDKGYLYDRGGPRKEVRKGVNLSMVNASGNSYTLDGVIWTNDWEPIVLLESKYLRYKKHNRDKASSTCSSHYSLRKKYPTIRKSIVILSGNWSKPSKLFLESFGIELHEVPFEYICSVLSDYKIDFNWAEKDRNAAKVAWDKFQNLSDSQKTDIAENLITPIRKQLTKSIGITLQGMSNIAQHITEIEILLKTDLQEYYVKSFDTIKDSLIYLLSLQTDSPDIAKVLSLIHDE